MTRTIREAIELSFEQIGGPDYLARMATEQPVAYMSLLGKVLPQQVEANINAKTRVVLNFGVQPE